MDKILVVYIQDVSALVVELETKDSVEEDRWKLIRYGLAYGSFVTRIFPFIRLMAISGSLTNPNYKRHNDIDYFIVVRKGHVWDTFVFCRFFSRFYARALGVNPRWFCFNYIIDETYVDKELDLNVKSAYEFLNLIIVRGSEVYLRIALSKKEILKSYYPQKYISKIRKILSNYHKENHSLIANIFGVAISIVSKFVACLLKPYVRVRERFWRTVLRRAGLTHYKFYSNGYVWRRHKK